MIIFLLKINIFKSKPIGVINMTEKEI